jgi:sorting nexin-8
VFKMSLFGTSPDESAKANTPKSRLALFDDEADPEPRSKSLLFADEVNIPDTSPWEIPTPKKHSRSELIKSLLSASDVPDGYVDLFDIVHSGPDNDGGMISSSGVARVLSTGSLSANDQAKIMSILAPDGQISSIGRNEFNVLLALIGLAQEKEEISLDSVDERRQS